MTKTDNLGHGFSTGPNSPLRPRWIEELIWRVHFAGYVALGVVLLAGLAAVGVTLALLVGKVVGFAWN